MAEQREILLGDSEIALFSRQTEAMERQATAMETIAELMGRVATEQEKHTVELEKMNERMGDKDLGVYMNPNLKDDRYTGGYEVSQAAFDVSMEDSEKVKDRMRNPIDWSID